MARQLQGIRGRRGLMAVPARSQEPYRIWFELLKLALNDPTLTVNREYYADWGDVKNYDFPDWWDEKWEDLFAVEIGVYRIKNFNKLFQQRNNEIVVRLPLYRDVRETLDRVQAILEEHHAGDRLRDMQQGKYRFYIGEENGHEIHPATRFLRDTDTVAVLLNYYRFWMNNIKLDETEREKQTGRDYYDWVVAGRNEQNDTTDPNPRHMPMGLADYVEYLDYLDGRNSGQPSLIDLDQNVQNRRPFKRNLEKAKRLAANVAQGVFPGRYSD